MVYFSSSQSTTLLPSKMLLTVANITQFYGYGGDTFRNDQHICLPVRLYVCISLCKSSLYTRRHGGRYISEVQVLQPVTRTRTFPPTTPSIRPRPHAHLPHTYPPTVRTTLITTSPTPFVKPSVYTSNHSNRHPPTHT